MICTVQAEEVRFVVANGRNFPIASSKWNKKFLTFRGKMGKCKIGLFSSFGQKFQSRYWKSEIIAIILTRFV